MTGSAPDRYPGYNVLDKRHTPSWDEPTRRVVNRRLAVSNEPRFFADREWRILLALCARILPQPSGRPPIPTASLLDAALFENQTQGFRSGDLPYDAEAWRRGLAALEAEAQQAFGKGFDELEPASQDALLIRAQNGDLTDPAWGGMGSARFFANRVLADIPAAYYSHPTAWSEIGFGGPASPRGYVRMALNRRDPWEAIEAKPDPQARIRAANRHVG